MSAWDTYARRMNVRGANRRDVAIKREQRFINTKLPGNPSFQTVEIYPPDIGYNIDIDGVHRQGNLQNVAIDDRDNYDEKVMFSMPGEDIILGSLVYWMDNYWLATERDANTTVRTRVKLNQCNHLLKWITDDDEIIEQWCIFEDGTKYLTGHYEDYDFFTSRGDARTSIQMAKNKYTTLLDRENRFLLDDPDSPIKLAYQLTKPLKGTLLYNGTGTYSFVLQEVQSTDNDNQELGIADYYLHFPKDGDSGNKSQHYAEPDMSHENDDAAPEGTGKKVWI